MLRFFVLFRQFCECSVLVFQSEMCSINRIEVLNECNIAQAITLTKICGLKDSTIQWSVHLDPVVCSIAANRSSRCFGFSFV